MLEEGSERAENQNRFVRHNSESMLLAVFSEISRSLDSLMSLSKARAGPANVSGALENNNQIRLLSTK